VSRVFLTKVWGFSPESYPALGFNAKGARDKLLRESLPGDWVILAGTKGLPTVPEYQGRLLGKVQLGKEEINVENILSSIGTNIPKDHYHDDGRYRWPFGLPMIEAQRFIDLPDLSELFGNYLPGTQWASYALDVEKKLGVEAVKKIESLRCEKVNIIEAPEIIRQRKRNRALSLNNTNGATGPGPSNSRKGTERESSSASAYIMKLHGSLNEVYKIGYSSNVLGRLADLNKGLITGVTNFYWEVIQQQAFPDEKQAYNFEQLMHRRLNASLVEGEREIYLIKYKELNSVWIDEFYNANWATI